MAPTRIPRRDRPCTAIAARSLLAVSLAVAVAAGSIAAQNREPSVGTRVLLGPAEQAPPPDAVPDVPMPARVINELPSHGPLPIPRGTNALPPPDSPPSTASGPVGAGGGPCDIDFFINQPVEPAGANRSTVGEPSVALNRDVAFQTGNWYAALSKDSGMSWSSINPATRFGALDAGFCCDQRTIYVPSHDITIWYLQYSYSRTTDRGSVRIAVSLGRDGLRDNVWQSFVFNPESFGRSRGEWLDFPDIAHSNNFLYAASNVFNATGSNVDSVVWKMPLSELRAGGNLNTVFWRREGARGMGGTGSYRLSQGAAGEMIWGTHVNTATLRVFRNLEGSNGVRAIDQAVSPWVDGPYFARAPNAVNWAGRTDGRVTGAYVTQNEYGFLWTASTSRGRPVPYTRVARFRTPNDTRIGDEDIWDTRQAFMYPAAAVNNVGHIGCVLAVGSDTMHPSTGALIVDDCRPVFAGTVTPFATGTSSPSRAAWGDYYTIQRHPRSPRTFVGTGMAQRGGSADDDQEPRYLWFGRGRDQPTWVALFVQDVGFPGAVPITVDETDVQGRNDGDTSFIRLFSPRQGYTLTAPQVVGSNYLFCNWRLRSAPTGSFVDQPADQLTLTVSDIGTANDTAQAVYAVVRGVAVHSINPASGIPISVDRADFTGASDGVTTFARIYKTGARVTFTAPPNNGIHPFKQWHVDGVPQTLGANALTVDVTPGGNALRIDAEYHTHVHGGHQPFGQGCALADRSVPVLTSVTHPDIGNTVIFRVQTRPGISTGTLLLGFSNRAWLSFRLPLSLGFLGMDPSCSLYTSIQITNGLRFDPLGIGTFGFRLSAPPSAIGGHFYTQAMVFDPSLRTQTPWAVSNALDTTIGGNR